MKVITKEILHSLKEGNHQAFENIFVAYFNKVKYFIEKIIRSGDDAEDLAQDIFVRLWNNREKIDTEKSFDAYLFTMAYNASCNFIKHLSVKENYEKYIIPSSDHTDPETLLYAKEIALLIEMTVEQMPEQRKKIYRLSRNEGLKNEEIARELDISKKTVENQLSLALKEIRKILIFFVFLYLSENLFF